MLAVDPLTQLPVVLLERAGEPSAPPADRTCRRPDEAPLVVCVGRSEAAAIAAELEGIELERPMTHQLMGSLLEAAGTRVLRVELDRRGQGAFSARIHLLPASGEPTARDARASDALALALHTGAEIHVPVRLLQQAARDHDRARNLGAAGLPAGPELQPAASRWQAEMAMPRRGACVDGDLADMSDEAFGKWKM